jgi:hypothetical protein
VAEIDRWKVPLRGLGMSDIENEMNMGMWATRIVGALE